MSEYLYVPITVKGFVVGKVPDSDWRVDALYDFTKLDNDPLGRNVKNDFTQISDMQKGVHLHWSLPDALTHGNVSVDGKNLDFPCVPNRWLVTRMWTDSAESQDKIQSRSWIIQSDALAQNRDISQGNIGSPTRPCLVYERQRLKYDKPPYRYLGRSFPAETTVDEPEEYVEKLIAIEPGNPAYAAYYPSARNVFGFYDDMTGLDGKQLENIKICYCVSGWYDRHSNDPLTLIPNREYCLKKMGWESPEGTGFPRLTLCHGMLLDMRWGGPEENYFSELPAPPCAALGNNSAEALAALNAALGVNRPQYERLMNHFIAGNHSFEASAAATFEAENRLHQNKFGHLSRSNTYILVSEDNHNEPIQENAALESLNAAMAKDERIQSELEHIRQSLYESWVRRVRTDDDAIDDTIMDLCDAVNEKKRELQKTLETATGLAAEIRTAISDKVELIMQSGQRFWEANNPVLLLSGIKRDYSHGWDGRFSKGGALKARTLAISALTVEPISGLLSKKVTVNAEDLFNTVNLQYPCAKQILSEALLLNTGFAVTIAKRLLIAADQKPDGAAVAKLASEVKKLQTALTVALRTEGYSSQHLSVAAGMDADYPDKTAVEYWKHPWNPLYLFWECEYIADANVIKETPDLSNWTRNGSDYKYNSRPKPDSPKCTINGHAILTPHIAVQVSSLAKRMFGDDAGTKDLAVLSQELGGIHSQLILSGLPIQFPVADLYDGSEYLAHDVYKALEGCTPAFCEFDELFSPIRAGELVFKQIAVVDSFGQVLHVDVNAIAIGESLRSDSPIMSKTAMLPPRIMQPARIDFSWRIPDSSLKDWPICGWLVPNRLETNICVFDIQGNMLGYLQRVESKENPVVWKAPQDMGGGTVEPPQDIDPDLYGFISAILDISLKGQGSEKDVLTDLIATIDKSFWSINPATLKQMNALNFYFGRPLVLAKANVMLELMSEPKRYRQLYPNKPPKNISVALDKAVIPVQIGQDTNHNDGTIGFFVEGHYDCLHLCGGDLEPSNKKYFSKERCAYLSPKATTEYTQITFLFDPTGEINLDSAILPVKTRRIAPDIVSAALDKLYYAVFAAPVLTSCDAFSVPYPEIEGKTWSWIGYRNDEEPYERDDLHQAEAQAVFSPVPFTAMEGWLKLKNQDKNLQRKADTIHGKR